MLSRFGFNIKLSPAAIKPLTAEQLQAEMIREEEKKIPSEPKV